MPEVDLAADLSRGLEVKPSPGATADEGASPSSDAGDAAQGSGRGDPNDRKALNRASEALKESRKLRADVDRLTTLAAGLMEENRSMIARLQGASGGGNGNGSGGADAKPPYSRADLSAMLAANETDKFTEAMEANNDWARRRDRAEVRTELSQELTLRNEGDRLNAYLLRELGFANADQELVERIETTADDLRRQFPKLDPATARVIAGGKVWRQVATDPEYEDLRTEHLRRSSGTPEALPSAGGPPPPAKIEWDAPNRGLPPEIVKRMHTFRLGHTLQRAKDPKLEAEYRKVIEDILRNEQMVNHKRAIGGYF